MSLGRAIASRPLFKWLLTLPPIALGVGLSVLFHGYVLLLKFEMPDASSMREKALDIILVNAKSAKKPRDAQALAQSNLDGGGNTDENRRAKTPLPPTAQQTTGDDLQQMQRRVQELEAAQNKMLTQAKSLRSFRPVPPPANSPRRPRASPAST